jgi:hypothetical protein
MKTLGSVYLTWRIGRGHHRHVIGVTRNKKDADSFYFKYLVTPEIATQIGFVAYTAFPNLQKTYTENVLDIFGLRLTRAERSDIQKYYDFWEIEPRYKNDKRYLLAHTQGLLATDNFEFLADYYPSKKLSFISEIYGLSHYNPPPEILIEGEELQWQYDRQNKYDKFAVKVFKDATLLGYVKTIHSKTFYKKGGDALKIQVKSIDKNGRINRIFVKIYMPVCQR